MAESATLTAVIDLVPKTDFINVEGTVMVHSSVYTIDVIRADPQGINNRELILDVVVAEQEGPMKGTMAPFGYNEMVHGAQFDTVRARFNHGVEDVTCTVTVIPES